MHDLQDVNHEEPDAAACWFEIKQKETRRANCGTERREGAGGVVGVAAAGFDFRIVVMRRFPFSFRRRVNWGSEWKSGGSFLVCGGFERYFRAIELSASSLHFAFQKAAVVGLSVRLGIQ